MKPFRLGLKKRGVTANKVSTISCVPLCIYAQCLEAVRHLRTLLSLILTNSEARKLLSDFSLIGRDLLSKGAIKAAEAIAPPQEALAHVDETAPSDQFITEGGRAAGPNETPIVEADVPFTDKTVRQHPREDEARLRNGDGTERPIGEVRQEGESRLQNLRDQGLQTKDETVAQASREADEYRDADPEEANAKKTGLMNKMRNVRVSGCFIHLNLNHFLLHN